MDLSPSLLVNHLAEEVCDVMSVSPFLLRASYRYSKGEGQWEGKENENENEEAVGLVSGIHHISSR